LDGQEESGADTSGGGGFATIGSSPYWHSIKNSPGGFVEPLL
jgi:hypothetical protein